MKVKINQAIASPEWSYRRGQVVEMAEDQGRTWVQSGLASVVDEPADDSPPPPAAKPAKQKGKRR